MLGAIVINGMERYVPEIRSDRDRIKSRQNRVPSYTLPDTGPAGDPNPAMVLADLIISRKRIIKLL
jgi:hypothetical protein